MATFTDRINQLITENNYTKEYVASYIGVQPYISQNIYCIANNIERKPNMQEFNLIKPEEHRNTYQNINR